LVGNFGFILERMRLGRCFGLNGASNGPLNSIVTVDPLVSRR